MRIITIKLMLYLFEKTLGKYTQNLKFFKTKKSKMHETLCIAACMPCMYKSVLLIKKYARIMNFVSIYLMLVYDCA